MVKYIIKRIIQIIPMLFAISIICFFIIKMAPGSPIKMYERPGMNYHQVEIIRHNLGLDKPIIIQYFYWFKNVLKGNLGYSLISGSKVIDEIGIRLIPSLILSIISIILTFLFGIILGIIGGKNKGNKKGKIIDILSSISIATPSFLIALILIIIFTVELNLLPNIGMYDVGDKSILGLIVHLIMPVTAMVLSDIGGIIQYVKGYVEIEMEKDYVKTSLGRGLSKEKVFYKHVLKNSILPVITLIGMSLPNVVMGSVVIEQIFAWPGVGRLAYNAATGFDYPTIMAITMFGSILLILGNLISDILYFIVDPRIKGGLK